MVWLSHFLSCSNYCSFYGVGVKERQNPHCNRADPAFIQVYTIYMITYITYYLPPPLFECDHNLSTVHFWAIMVHIEVFWAYFHKPPDFASVCLATWFKESSTVIHISNTRSHSDKKSIIPSFMVSNLPLVSGIHLLSALMEYHTLAPSSAWFPTKYTSDEGLFFKGLSKGLIPSDTIGVDFYIKKTEPHKKGRATCIT